MIRLFTDGSSIRRPPYRIGGWAYQYKVDSGTISDSGYVHHGTNNEMELRAVVEGLLSMRDVIHKSAQIIVISDSRYVIDGASKWIHTWKDNKWKLSTGKSVKNRKLWEQLDENAKYFRTRWHWVRGHDGHEDNEAVDELARQASSLGAQRLCV